MPIDVKIPSMGESITGGILAAWHARNGDFVKRDQILYELETDKITSEGVAESDGRLTIEIEAGAEVEIGQKIATIDPDQTGSPTDEPSKETTATKPPEPDPQQPERPVSVPKEEPTAERSSASPAVRRLAAESGINPESVSGTGKAGRVTKGDMLEAIKAAERTTALEPTSEPDPSVPAPGEPKSAPVAPVSSSTREDGRVTRRKMTPLRQRIAQRLVASQKDAAILTTFNEVDMQSVKDLRARYQDAFTKRYGIKLGFMSFFIKAVVHALKEVPAVNGRIDGDSIIENHFYDIGVAVSTERGLLVPVIRNCDQLSLAEIESELAAYSNRAREGKITIQDLEGGVFTVSNGGIFGSLLSTPIINPPQAGILGMHAIQDRPVARDGQVIIRPMMYLALSYDHRLVDGRQAVTFLVKVKEAIEDPARLVLGV
ncbi:MAG: dihydrolipoamide succinyltransferase [Verrucomicrobia bacterium]|nr:MAG: dihydrolipoamide succinyltransferase [Verrucomicrobiota bacterium]